MVSGKTKNRGEPSKLKKNNYGYFTAKIIVNNAKIKRFTLKSGRKRENAHYHHFWSTGERKRENA